MTLRCRFHGPAGRGQVAVLHGGPGARGSAGGLARLIADPVRVVEPMQRTAAEGGRTVADHVADLRAVVDAHLTPAPLLIGHSWGAMLALAYAVDHPVCALVLVGSGTFDGTSREAFRAAMPGLASLALEDRFAAIDRAYHVDPLPPDPLDADDDADDAPGNADSWHDMLRLQAEGHFPAAFASIAAPVLMIHGADDPHPGWMIRDSLPIAGLAYVELPACGHYPWHERRAREPFAAVLREFVDRMK